MAAKLFLFKHFDGPCHSADRLSKPSRKSLQANWVVPLAIE